MPLYLLPISLHFLHLSSYGSSTQPTFPWFCVVVVLPFSCNFDVAVRDSKYRCLPMLPSWFFLNLFFINILCYSISIKIEFYHCFVKLFSCCYSVSKNIIFKDCLILPKWEYRNLLSYICMFILFLFFTVMCDS
uniref:Uncharacterized protein n=1 Tax=Pipistrellus kuhlii TaxID=59472 RepID=A0A7J7Y953_PIPKU|nr:hypothetical protein mPipKuh1_010290 [Pipistrellus kuhlii]